MLNNGKATIEKTSEGLNIIIPSKKNWFTLLFGTAWIGGWFFGFTFGSQVLFSTCNGFNGFMTFWLLGWTIGGIAIMTLLLWGYFGKEKFTPIRNEVLFEKTVFGIGLKNRLEKSEIKNFRTELGIDTSYNGNRWAFWGVGPGKIKFDYGFKTYSFGLGVDDAEAEHIVGLLKEQFKEE